MTILFLIALVLAWPTYGLSLFLWLIILILNGIAIGKDRVASIDARRNRETEIDRLFNGRYAEFFRALDIPMLLDCRTDATDAEKCGRHIMRYVAHNPDEDKLFVQGLRKWTTKGGALCNPVIAANDERRHNSKGEVHLVAYRAMEALIYRNEAKCFHCIDYGKLVEKRLLLEGEMAGLLKR